MAQPVFDDHPLEQYLREAGEVPDLMPGGTAEFMPTAEQDDEAGDSSFDVETSHEIGSTFLKDTIQAVRSMVSPQSSSAFVERFKYSVISSSLLSSSLLQSPSSRPIRLPGHHSRNSSLDPPETPHQSIHSLTPDFHYYTFFLALALVTFSFGAGYYLTSLLLIGISTSFFYICNPESSSKYDMTPHLDTLHDLIAAGNVWDSVVQEAMTTLEKDEESTPNSPFSPASSLRVTLHSALLTTQSQCDDVRQLLSALASQSELPQISEMYAPPSPMSSKFSPLSPTRPSSYPETISSRRRTISVPDNKRATWNGSYSYLANAGSPSIQQISKRREKRRSDLSALLAATGGDGKSLSVPTTPNKTESSPLEGVTEEEDTEAGQNDAPSGVELTDKGYQAFGPAALRLRRTRTIGGLNALRASISLPGSPPTKSSPSSTNFSVRSPRSLHFATIPAASRFTTIQASRHPLSFSSLRLALQNALASKRYACSHLLALRFTEEGDDEAYWEDVKSVMSLLTSTLADAGARLTEALDFVDEQRREDETPSPSASQAEVTMEDVMFGDIRMSSLLSGRDKVTIQESFAPMPSRLHRFASHVEAISSALDDAREQLIECVVALKSEGNTSQDGTKDSDQLPPSSSSSDVLPPAQDAHPALQAYERLRRELGLALRECERGREHLLDIVSPPRQRSEESEDELSSSGGDHSSPDVPSLAHDGSDESSEKPDIAFPLEYEEPSDSTAATDRVTIVNALDDVTSHLLLTSTSQHLPPPGIEQVYEGDSIVGAFKRERSKLTREERIQLAKKAKEEGEGGSDQVPSFSRERWGPGGEVVQELKDVIWKVGERRRKMVDGQVHNVIPETAQVRD